MTRNEAVQKLATAGRLSIAHAEDLYDSFFPKPVVPQYVSDWYEEHRDDYDDELWDYLTGFDYEEDCDFKEWVREYKNQPITTLINMHQFGYEVEKEPRYTVRIKGVDGYATHLNENLDNHEWFFASKDDIEGYRTKHTRKELEDAGFGWVFDCQGVEVKEVE
ncbi:DUF1642 domain-containing protein [Streptococcus salivarius]|uniref:DUF1642 domain-containing protein n=1 Tax=Streptococcus salivarius TaxID=1304 RepID=UPI0039C40CFE